MPSYEGGKTIGGKVMKKLICFSLCVIMLCGCCTACKHEEVSLTKDNISDYISIEITFGEVSVEENNTSGRLGKYYITSLATISIKPKGDYKFTDASVTCFLNKTGSWYVSNTSNTLNLDKDGYGEKTVMVYSYSMKSQGVYPSSVNWNPRASNASGTVTIN